MLKRFPGRLAASLLLASALASTATAQAAPRETAEDIVHRAYTPFFQAHPDVKTDVAVIDMGGVVGQAVEARFDSPLTCEGSNCLRVVLTRVNGTDWSEAFAQHTTSLTLGPVSPAALGGQGVRELVSGNGIAWRWVGGPFPLMPVLSTVGTPFPADVNASKDDIAIATPFLADEIPHDGEKTVFTSKRVALDGGPPALWVTAQSGMECGDDGCPFVLLGRNNGSVRVLLKAVSTGYGAVMRTASHGLADLAFQQKAGLEFYSFDGSTYRLVQTTYPSKVTPAP